MSGSSSFPRPTPACRAGRGSRATLESENRTGGLTSPTTAPNPGHRVCPRARAGDYGSRRPAEGRAQLCPGLGGNSVAPGCGLLRGRLPPGEPPRSAPRPFDPRSTRSGRCGRRCGAHMRLAPTRCPIPRSSAERRPCEDLRSDAALSPGDRMSDGGPTDGPGPREWSTRCRAHPCPTCTPPSGGQTEPEAARLEHKAGPHPVSGGAPSRSRPWLLVYLLVPKLQSFNTSGRGAPLTPTGISQKAKSRRVIWTHRGPDHPCPVDTLWGAPKVGPAR